MKKTVNLFKTGQSQKTMSCKKQRRNESTKTFLQNVDMGDDFINESLKERLSFKLGQPTISCLVKQHQSSLFARSLKSSDDSLQVVNNKTCSKVFTNFNTCWAKRNLTWKTFIFTSLIVGYFFSGVNTASLCTAERCMNAFVKITAFHNIPEGHNTLYCTALQRYHVCNAALSSSCRGNLKFHSDQQMIDALLNTYECATLTEDEGLVEDWDAELEEAGREKKYVKAPDPCSPPGPPSPPVHCGLFGDPHLRTFEGTYVTCRALGAWPLLDTPLLAVQVTNELVGDHLQATATTKVTTIIKQFGTCSAGHTYEASTDDLPRAFVDGTSSGGGSVPSARVEEVVPGREVRIHARHANVTVTIRRLHSYLGVWVTLPPELGEGSGGLCVTGCPAGELVATAPPALMPEEEALSHCTALNLTDHFLNACMFDLLATADATFSAASSAAQAELWRQAPVAAAATLDNCTMWPCHTALPLTSAADRTADCIAASAVLAALLAAVAYFYFLTGTFTF